MLRPICPYCNQGAELVFGSVLYPKRPELSARCFWLCEPCDAYVGCHEAGKGFGDGTRPLGILANAQLRGAKIRAHGKFDALWNTGQMTRKAAYAWLSQKMGLQPAACHIGMFSVEQCQRVHDLCEDWLAADI